MPEKRKTGAEIMNKGRVGKLKIMKVSYGSKNLMNCMESIIRLHMEK